MRHGDVRLGEPFEPQRNELPAKLLASLLEQQTILAKQHREATTNAINADISRRANLSGNILQVTSTLTDSLQNFRMP